MTLAVSIRRRSAPPTSRSLRSEEAIPTGIRAPPLGGAIRGNRRDRRRDWHTRFFRAEKSKRQAARDERALRPAPQDRVRPSNEKLPTQSFPGLLTPSPPLPDATLHP